MIGELRKPYSFIKGDDTKTIGVKAQNDTSCGTPLYVGSEYLICSTGTSYESVGWCNLSAPTFGDNSIVNKIRFQVENMDIDLSKMKELEENAYSNLVEDGMTYEKPAIDNDDKIWKYIDAIYIAELGEPLDHIYYVPYALFRGEKFTHYIFSMEKLVGGYHVIVKENEGGIVGYKYIENIDRYAKK